MDAQQVLIGTASAILLTLLGLAGLYATSNHRDTLPFQQGLFVSAIAVRFAAALALAIPSVYQAIVGSADASGWQAASVFKQSIDQADLGPLAIPRELWASFDGVNRGYHALVGVYFYVTRLDSELSAAALSCFAGAMTAVTSYRLAGALFSEWVAVRVGWLVCLFPSMIVWSIQTIKEPFVILLEVIAIYACTILRTRGFSLWHILIWTLSILFVLPLRFYAAYMLAGVFVVALLAPNFGGGSVPLGSAIAGAIILFSVLSMASNTVQTHQETFEIYDLDRVQEFRDAVATGDGAGSGVQSPFDMKSRTGLILASLLGALHLLLAPFPWQFAGSSTRFLLTFPEMIVWWILVARGLFKGLAHCLRRQPGDVLAMLLFMILLGSVYSLMFGNIGIIYRQRAQLLPYLLMIIMVGFEASRARHPTLAGAADHVGAITPLARASSALELAS
jgi:hypothetical protein